MTVSASNTIKGLNGTVTLTTGKILNINMQRVSASIINVSVQFPDGSFFNVTNQELAQIQTDLITLLASVPA